MSGGIFHPSIFHPSIFDTGNLGDGRFTAQSVTATPGRRYAGFVAKTPAVLVSHVGLFTKLSVMAVPGGRYTSRASRLKLTALSVIALPGQRQNFIAKTSAVLVPHEGLFTALQVIAVPGKRTVFLAKTEAEIIAVSAAEEIMGPPDQDFRFYNRVIREDDEILTFILNAVTSGILDS